MSRRFWWYALPAVCLAPGWLAGGLFTVYAGGSWLVPLWLGYTSLVMVYAQWLARRWFQHGWARGMQEGAAAVAQIQHGRTPASLPRQMATGCAAPEPWDDPPTEVVVFGYGAPGVGDINDG